MKPLNLLTHDKIFYKLDNPIADYFEDLRYISLLGISNIPQYRSVLFGSILLI
jgi:hypothetical protein